MVRSGNEEKGESLEDIHESDTLGRMVKLGTLLSCSGERINSPEVGFRGSVMSMVTESLTLLG